MDNIRTKIMDILDENSTSVTELKKLIPEIKSFGTLAYHLKILEKEGKVFKRVYDKERGKPTYYFTKRSKKDVSMRYEELKINFNKKRIKEKLRVLSLLKKGSLTQNSKDYDINLIPVLALCNSEGLSVISHNITPKGIDFLKQNSNYKEDNNHNKSNKGVDNQ